MYFAKEKLLLDNMRFKSCEYDMEGEIYLIIYKRMDSDDSNKGQCCYQDVGVYIKTKVLEVSIDVDKQLEIASIVKILTYLTCERIRRFLEMGQN